MSEFPLQLDSIDVQEYSKFINGLSELNAIDLNTGHTFHKHNELYNLNNYLKLVQTSGQTEQVLIGFLEKMSSLSENIETEEQANSYFIKSLYAFIGIDFDKTTISSPSQITDSESYKNWCFNTLPPIEKLKSNLGSHSFSDSFIHDFNKEDIDIQLSILAEFEKARKRNLITSYYPDNSIIKNVTPDKTKVKVYELRVYQPVALRVYFNESKDIIKIASLDKKSNPNQTEDIKNAQRILKSM